MKGFPYDGDKVRMYFANYDRRPDDEGFEEVASILKIIVNLSILLWGLIVI